MDSKESQKKRQFENLNAETGGQESDGQPGQSENTDENAETGGQESNGQPGQSENTDENAETGGQESKGQGQS